MYTIVLHVSNADPVKIDVEELPTPQDTCIIGKNPRMKSDKELDWVDEGVNTVIFPWHRITYIQVWPSDEDTLDFPLTYRD